MWRTEGKTAYAIACDLSKDAVPTAWGARLVASYGPRAVDAGRRSLITAIADWARRRAPQTFRDAMLSGEHLT